MDDLNLINYGKELKLKALRHETILFMDFDINIRGAKIQVGLFARRKLFHFRESPNIAYSANWC